MARTPMSVTKRQREQAKRDKHAKKAEKKAERLKNPQQDSDIDDSFIGGEPETDSEEVTQA